jgi:uncharacterized damage-inducible protein DinB
MFQHAILALYERDLQKLKDELSAYPEEAMLWAVRPGISNSAGTLCLHLNGNLRHFIGAVLGHSGYIRQRELEFSQKDIPKKDLLRSVDETLEIVRSTLGTLKEKDFENTFPIEVMDKTWSTGHFLLHLLTHLNYHLGQINYHRRLLAGK